MLSDLTRSAEHHLVMAELERNKKMEINWLEEIEKVRKYCEREPELVAFIVRDWKITEESGLHDLAWAMTRDNVWKKDAEFLLDELDKYVKSQTEARKV